MKQEAFSQLQAPFPQILKRLKGRMLDRVQTEMAQGTVSVTSQQVGVKFIPFDIVPAQQCR